MSEQVLGYLHRFSPLLCLPCSFLRADLNTSLWAEPRLFLKLLLPLLSIIFLLERQQDPVESVPKYCPPRGPALAPGTRLPPPGSRGSACLAHHSLSVSMAGRGPPGAWMLPSPERSVPPHIPRAERRQEGPADLTSPLTDGSLTLPPGARAEAGPDQPQLGGEAALDNNSLAVPCPPEPAQDATGWTLPLCPPPQTSPLLCFQGQVLRPRKHLPES